MGIWQVIGRQAQNPTGFVGRLVTRFMTRMTRAHSAWTVEVLDIQPGDHLLEVGFGAGVGIQLLAERTTEGHVAGVDISDTMLEMASARNAGSIAQGRVELVKGDGKTIPYSDGHFDKVCTINTIYVVSEPSQLFAELYRVLKPGGLAAVTFPVREHFMKFRPTRTPGFHMHEVEDLQSALEHAGFTDVRIERNDSVKFGSNCLLGTK